MWRTLTLSRKHISSPFSSTPLYFNIKKHFYKTGMCTDLIYIENEKRTLPIWCCPWIVFKVIKKVDSTYSHYLLVAPEHRGGICIFIEFCRCQTITYLAYPEFWCENPMFINESAGIQKWSTGRFCAPPQMFYLSFPLRLVFQDPHKSEGGWCFLIFL